MWTNDKYALALVDAMWYLLAYCGVSLIAVAIYCVYMLIKFKRPKQTKT